MKELRAQIAAIVAAAGSGSRFASSGGTAKQFIELHGRPLYIWSLLALAGHPKIDAVVVVAPESHIETIKEHRDRFRAELPGSQNIHVTAGGATRQESVRLGLQYLKHAPAPPEFVLIHDGARPFISPDLITRIVDEVQRSGACTPGLPVTDTLKRVNQNKIIETVDRQELYSVQTPQAGRLADLWRAHERAVLENWSVTDDASMLERDGHQVAIVPGSPYNLKITQPLDLVLCEALAPRLLI